MNHAKKLALLFLSILATGKAGAIDISGSGWRLWLDKGASWKDDTLYLPAELKLSSMPLNPPSGGWQVLSPAQGIGVSLPSSVEEHYWGSPEAGGLRPYAANEAANGKDTTFPNGNYNGVSWWWRSIEVPELKPGQRLILHVRGARLRTEVYCNGKLCGYNLMTELPFDSDLSQAVKAGQEAQLALRITNPGGHLDWIDFSEMNIQWGKYTLPASHGFGGLDSGIELEVRDAADVEDLAVINTPDLHKVHLIAELKGFSQGFQGNIHLAVNKEGKELWSKDAPASLKAGQSIQVEADAVVPEAQAWDLKHPELYKATATLGHPESDGKSVDFGFRYFTVEGLGTQDATLRLNGKRSVLISAISWGFWARNGLWPDRAMAEKEVAHAKELGLNCLQFHRNIGKPAVLEAQDRRGLLRFEEPGAGKFAFGRRFAKGPFAADGSFFHVADAFAPKDGYVEPDKVDTSGKGSDGDAVEFWEKYEEEKILEMVRRDRSHPSLIQYNLQNESDAIDLRNPRIYRIFREIHALDPSRIITLFSGGVPREHQVLMLPYSDEIRYGSKSLAYAGWRDIHTCGGPVNYMDNLYKDPRHFFQRSKDSDHGEICMWGEMLGSGCPDDYEALVHSFDAEHPSGYELEDAKKVLAGYHSFLDRWGFRKAFPTDSSLFQSIGDRTYYFWKRVVGQSRADNANDFLVISGWESTSIDNHSGLVDNHRNFKGNPKILAESCKEELLFIQPRHMVLPRCGKELVDIFLINEAGRQGPQTLNFRALRPDGSVAFQSETSVSAAGGDQYGQLLAEGLEFRPDLGGIYKLEAELKGAEGKALKAEDQIHVVQLQVKPLLKKIAVLETDHEAMDTLSKVYHAQVQLLTQTAASETLDAIVLGSKSTNADLGFPQGAFAAALARVKKDGVRLLLWPDNDKAADAFASSLAKAGIVKYQGLSGNLGAPWFGSWFFTRKHWLLEGLPTDSAVDWRWGVSAFNGPAWLQEDPAGSNTEGLLLDAKGMEVAVGYGADHNSKVGVAGCMIPYGKGQIVLYSLPQMLRSLGRGNWAMNQAVARRLLANALAVKGSQAAVPGPCGDEEAESGPAALKAKAPSALPKASGPDVISVNFMGGGQDHGTPQAMGPAESAGILPATHWNSLTGASGSASGLMDASGAKTGLSLTWDSRNTWSTTIEDRPGDNRMMKGYIDTADNSTTKVVVSGVPESFVKRGYRVIVYFDGDDAEDQRIGRYSIGTVAALGTDPGNSFFDGHFANAWDADKAKHENYLELEGLKEGNFRLEATPEDSTGPNYRAPLNGFQIVAENAEAGK
jgi:hypothetical protein